MSPDGGALPSDTIALGPVAAAPVSADSAQVGGRPRREALSPRKFVGVIAACMGLSALSIDLCLPAFSDIRAEFGFAADSAEVSALVTVYFLGLAGGQLIFGPLSDRLGRKPVLCIGFTVFVVGAAGAALVPSFAAVQVFRVLWGIGAAAPRTIAMAMVRDVQQGDQMARTMSLAMAIYLLVPVLAPTLGQALLTISPWRVVFWVPAGAAIAVLVWIVRRLPESLPPERRRSVSPRALVGALREVVSHRQTALLGLAVAFMFGGMTTFIGSSELLIDDVFGRPEIFALMFGIVGCLLGLSALLNARLVVRVGVERMLRLGSIYVVLAAIVTTVVSRIDGGTPPLWMFWPCVALMLPGVSMLVPLCNTAAMVPLPHVAGMASAVLGAVSTAGGALLGSLADGAFDGTVGPFALYFLVYVSLGALAINIAIGRRPSIVRSLEPHE